MHVVHELKLSGVDLNLFVLLDALLSERSVTRAARRVGLSQSAASHALARLPVPSEFVGLSLRAANYRVATGLSVLTVVRPSHHGKETRLLPDPDMLLKAGDSLIVMGPIEEISVQRGDAP